MRPPFYEPGGGVADCAATALSELGRLSGCVALAGKPLKVTWRLLEELSLTGRPPWRADTGSRRPHVPAVPFGHVAGGVGSETSTRLHRRVATGAVASKTSHPKQPAANE